VRVGDRVGQLEGAGQDHGEFRYISVPDSCICPCGQQIYLFGGIFYQATIIEIWTVISCGLCDLTCTTGHMVQGKHFIWHCKRALQKSVIFNI
jgi:hypothetical protein